MSTSKDLAQIERKAYETIWEDGLLDVFVGAGVLGIGVSWVSGHAVYGAILPALLVPVWQAARKKIVEPRTGYVEFSPARKTREKRGLGLMLLLGVLTLMLGIGVYFMARERPPELDRLLPVVIPALPAALLGFGGALVGFLFGIRRFLTYAALLFLGAAVGAHLGAGPGWHFLAPGLVILVVGVTLLASFLKKYPLAAAEDLP